MRGPGRLCRARGWGGRELQGWGSRGRGWAPLGGAGHPWGPPRWAVPRAQPLDPAAAKDVVTL